MTEITAASTVVRTMLEASRIEADLVLFDDRVGKYFATGPVGADIWDLISQPIAVSDLVSHLTARYEIDRQTCEDETLGFLREMSKRGLAQVSP